MNRQHGLTGSDIAEAAADHAGATPQPTTVVTATVIPTMPYRQPSYAVSFFVLAGWVFSPCASSFLPDLGYQVFHSPLTRVSQNGLPAHPDGVCPCLCNTPSK